VTESIISDHNVIGCSLELSKPTFPTKCVSSRKIKSIDTDQLKSDIIDSLGSHTDAASNVNDLVSICCSELSRILDTHAPLKKRRVVTRPAAPWYNDDIKDAKRLRRRLERKWRRSRDPADRTNYVEQCHVVTELLQSSRSNYYKDLINSHSDNPRKMFNTVGKLLHTNAAASSSQFPPHSSTKDLVDNFMNFFDAKIKTIHCYRYITIVNTVFLW